MEMATRISNLLNFFRENEMSIEIYCDKEGIRIYLPNGISLATLNQIAEILKETVGATAIDISVLKAEEEDMVCLAFFDEDEEADA